MNIGKQKKNKLEKKKIDLASGGGGEISKHRPQYT